MKIFFILFFSSVIFLFSSCTNESDLIPFENNKNNEIKLSASVPSAQMTKSLGPINSDFNFNFPIGVFAYNGSWNAGENANLINNDPATVSGSVPHQILFGNGPYYYPINGEIVKFFAFAPGGAVSTPAGDNAAPVVDIQINGKDDLLWGTAEGRKVGGSPAVSPVMQFNHKLTQLQFSFKAGNEEFQSKGSKVVSLKVMQQPATIHLNVGNGSYTSSGNIDMEALSATDKTNGISITTAGVDAKSPIMTIPSSGDAAYIIEVVVKHQGNDTPSTYVANLTVDAEIGKAHMINLTFLATGITSTVTVSDWITGSIGSGQVQ